MGTTTKNQAKIKANALKRRVAQPRTEPVGNSIAKAVPLAPPSRCSSFDMRRSWTGTHQTFDMQLDKGQEFEGGRGRRAYLLRLLRLFACKMSAHMSAFCIWPLRVMRVEGKLKSYVASLASSLFDTPYSFKSATAHLSDFMNIVGDTWGSARRTNFVALIFPEFAVHTDGQTVMDKSK